MKIFEKIREKRAEKELGRIQEERRILSEDCIEISVESICPNEEALKELLDVAKELQRK